MLPFPLSLVYQIIQLFELMYLDIHVSDLFVSLANNNVSIVLTTMQAWFLDQFGVLHDGKQAYPGAVSTCMFSLILLSL